MNAMIKSLIFQLSEIQSGKPWIGSNFDKKVENISDQDFFRIPASNMHSIAELISHLTVWRKETALKIVSGEGSITDADPSNWLDLDALKKIGRKELWADYKNSLKRIIELLKDKNDDFLEEVYYDTDFKGNYPYSFVLNGMLHHDLYHLGQIGSITKGLKDSK